MVPYPQENTTNFVFSPFTTRKGAGEREGRESEIRLINTTGESLNSSTLKGGGGGGGISGVEEERLRGGEGEEGGRDMTQREERDTDTDKQSGEWKKKKAQVLVGEKKEQKRVGKRVFYCFSVSTSPKWMRVVSKDSPQLSIQGDITTCSNREGEKSRKKKGNKDSEIGENSNLRIKRREECNKMSIQFVCPILGQEGGTNKLQKK